MRRLALSLTFALSVVGASWATYYNLGTSAPPTSVGGCTFIPFNLAAQAAIPNYTSVSTIPGAPPGYTLTTSYAVSKRTVPGSWGTWSHGYNGPVFFTGDGQTTLTLNISPAVYGFMLYVEPNLHGIFNCSVSTDAGDNSGPVGINGNSGATGFAFVSPSANINTITITCDPAANGFAVGEFAICTPPAGGGTAPPTPSLSHITSPEFGDLRGIDFKQVQVLTKKGPAIVRIESQTLIFISGIQIREFRSVPTSMSSLRSNAQGGSLTPMQTQEQNFILDLNAGDRPCGTTQFNLAGYCTVGIIFEPKSVGKKEAHLEVYYNTPYTARMYITGEGVQQSQTQPPPPQPPTQPPSGGSTGGSGASSSSSGGGGCSLSYGVHPLNAIGWLLIPVLVLARRIRKG